MSAYCLVCIQIVCAYYSFRKLWSESTHRKYRNFSLTGRIHSHRKFSVIIILMKTTHSCRKLSVNVALPKKVFCKQYSCREFSAEIGITEKCLPTVYTKIFCAYYSFGTFSSENWQIDIVLLLSRHKWIQFCLCTLFMHCVHCLHCNICLLVYAFYYIHCILCIVFCWLYSIHWIMCVIF